MGVPHAGLKLPTKCMHAVRVYIMYFIGCKERNRVLPKNTKKCIRCLQVCEWFLNNAIKVCVDMVCVN